MLHPIDGASPGPLLSRTPQQWRLFQAGEHLARVLQQHEILVGALPLREEGITELACTIRAPEASGDLREPNVCVQRVVLALVPGIVPYEDLFVPLCGFLELPSAKQNGGERIQCVGLRIDDVRGLEELYGFRRMSFGKLDLSAHDVEMRTLSSGVAVDG